jgi:cytochrome c-type biogenesis protein
MGVPESFLIDNAGKILHQWRGQFEPTSTETKEIIDTALAQQSPYSKSLVIKSNFNIKDNSIIQIGVPIAFTAGVLSFFSPCILPIIPSFIAFITGMSSDELLRRNKDEENIKNIDYVSESTNNKKETKYIEKVLVIKSRTFIRSCLFILGFSIVFVALGASLTVIGSAFQQYNRWIEIIGGILIIGFGLNLLEILKIPGAQRDRGYKFSTRPAGHLGSLLIGMGFGAGWTPCIGPILASILTMAAITTSIYQGILLLIVYSFGLAIPFIISSLAVDKYIKTFKRIRKWIPWIHRISVTLLMIIGILLLTGYLTLLTNSLSGLFLPLG